MGTHVPSRLPTPQVTPHNRDTFIQIYRYLLLRAPASLAVFRILTTM
jgi:hypothetical protein